MHKIVRMVLKYILILSVTFWSLAPVVWMISLSLKPPGEWYAPNVIPNRPILDNYVNLFIETVPIGGAAFTTSLAEPILKPFINSLIIAPLSTLFAVLIGFMAAYGVVRYRAGGNFILFFTLLTRMIPPATFLAPFVVYIATLRLMDTHIALILLYTAVTVTYPIWILKGFIEEIPPEWEEAALLEGASPWTVIRRVTLPLVRGGLLASALFVFILNWTEFLFALVISVVKVITVPVQVSLYASAVGKVFGAQAAAGLLATVPVVVIGYIIQRYLVTGFTFGRVR